jgi:hypothetical protein
VFWGIIFPTIVIVALLALPYLDVARNRRFAARRFMLSIGFASISLITILSYMGLPEFGVKVTADNDILHELVKPPAHNHMGVMLPVPFDQLVPGAYTTLELMAEDGEGSAAVNALNTQLGDTGTIANVLGNLRRANLTRDTMSFAPIPADAPELRHAVEEFAHMIEEREGELPNGWGGVVISPNQGNLKRIDVFIMWEDPSVTADTVQEGEIPGYRVASQHMFIHQNSQYFAAPGA